MQRLSCDPFKIGLSNSLKQLFREASEFLVSIHVGSFLDWFHVKWNHDLDALNDSSQMHRSIFDSIVDNCLSLLKYEDVFLLAFLLIWVVFINNRSQVRRFKVLRVPKGW